MFKKRVVSTLILIFASGIITSVVFDIFDTVSFRTVFILLSVISVFAYAFLSRFNRKKILKHLSAAALAVAAFSLGCLRVGLYDDTMSASAMYDKKHDCGEYKIVDINDNSLDVSVIASEIGVPKHTKIRVYLSEDIGECYIGDIIVAQLKYSYKESVDYYTNGIPLSSSAEIEEFRQGSGLFYELRKNVIVNSENLYQNFENASGISKAVIVGDRTGLDSYLFTIYNNAGISHVLAISGLHISIIAFSFHKLLIMLRAGRRLSGILSCLLAVVYTLLVGFNPAAVRSCFMVCILILAGLFLRESDGFTTLFVALFLLLIINPYSICSSGLQLSFLCTLGILLVGPVIDNIEIFFSSKRMHSKGIKLLFYKLLSLIISPAIMSFSASVFSFPVMFLNFDAVSYISPFVNIIAVPLFTAAVKLSFLSFLIAPISNFVAGIIAFPAGILYDIVTQIAKFIYDMDIGTISVHLEYMIIPLVLSFVLIGSLLFFEKHRKGIALITAFLFSLSVVMCGYLNTAFNKDKVIIEYGNDDSNYMFVDLGAENIYLDFGGYTSCPDTVFQNGSTSLDSYVILKYDDYTFKRFEYLSGNLKVSRLILPEPSNYEYINNFEKIKQLATARNCDIMYYEDYFQNRFNESLNLELFLDNANEGLLVSLDVNGIKFRFLNDKYDHNVRSNVAVLLSGYSHDCDNIYSDRIYADWKYINEKSDSKHLYKGYDNTLRFIINKSESVYKVYEP